MPYKYDVSIIIPTKNNEATLPRCLDSIINQVTSLKYEVIIVSDPSKDKTYEIIDEYVEKFDFIKHMKLQATPIGVARQIGINNSNGEFLMFIDADDYYSNDAIETMVNEIRQNDCDVVCSSYYYLRKNKCSKNFFSKNKTYNKKGMLIALMKDSYIHGFMWNKIYKSSLLKNKNYIIPNKNIIREDVLYNFQIFLNCKKMKQIKKPLYYYDKTHETTTSKIDKNRIPWFITIFAIEKYLLIKNYPDLIKKYNNLNFRRKLLVFGDEMLLKKGYSRVEYKLLKRTINKSLRSLRKGNSLSLNNEIWSSFFKEYINK